MYNYRDDHRKTKLLFYPFPPSLSLIRMRQLSDRKNINSIVNQLMT